VSELAAGDELTVLAVTPDRIASARYAGASGDFNPIHLDDDFARSVGLPGRILHGLHTMALLARAVTEAAGGPEHLRRLAVQFRGAAVPDQEITVSGTVTAREGPHVTLTVSAHQLGKAIIRGASAELEL
jgi:acyl dehydratase